MWRAFSFSDFVTLNRKEPMEVSHASTETQAIAIDINGEAEEVTVSTDADFMMTIAHGIYSNKALALVRELLCNARDGHAKAGTPDAPIHVTLTDNKLVVRDHGTGIANDVFTKIYMTFGSSTKRKSKVETGGFGVGSKVPWAVCDTFSARNWFEGKMTAYSIMRSDPKKDGKPSCTPIMTIPSTDPSGVEVTVPFPEKMWSEINHALTYFVQELGLNIILNKVSYHNTTYYNQEELKSKGYTILSNNPRSVVKSSPYYVRLGDVIYPLENMPEYKDAWDMLTHLHSKNYNPILFQAAPDSIAPTLSRESLQYTDKTMQSIRELMKIPLQEIADHIDAFAEEVRKVLPNKVAGSHEFTIKWWTEDVNLPSIFLNSGSKFYNPALSDSLNRLLIQNIGRWLSQSSPYIESQNLTGKSFREDIEAKLQKVFEKNLNIYPYLKKDGLLSLWNLNKDLRSLNRPRAKDLEKQLVRNAWEESMWWDQEALTNSLVTAVYFAKSPDIHRIENSSSHDSYFDDVKEIVKYKHKEDYFDRYTSFTTRGLYLSNTVVISTTLHKMVQRAKEKFTVPTDIENPLMPRGGLARLLGARFVRVKPTIKAADLNLLKKTYTDAGYDVLVLMDPTQAELAEAARLAALRAAEKEIPLPTLGKMIEDHLTSAYRHSLTDLKVKLRRLRGILKSEAYVGKPHYIILPRGKELPMYMRDEHEFMRLVRFTGSDIICVSTKTEIARVIKEGRISVEDTVFECLKLFYKTPGLYTKLYYENTGLSRLSAKDRLLTKYLFNRDVPHLTSYEFNTRNDFRELGKIMPKVSEYLNMKAQLYSDCPPDRHYSKLMRDYATSHFCDVETALKVAYQRMPSQRRALARSILKAIMKG